MVESLAVERADISRKLLLIRACLRAMTRDERRFIELRYFSNFPVKVIEREMRWSRRELYRLRTSILAKAEWLLRGRMAI